MSSCKCVLQEELLSLKQAYHQQLHLKKALAGSATFPFPLLIELSIEPPASAEAYDISMLKVWQKIQYHVSLYMCSSNSYRLHTGVCRSCQGSNTR